MIDKITLKFGRRLGSTPLEIETTPVTVFVGPNNSGKSRAIAEIFGYCNAGHPEITNVILERMSFHDFTQEEAENRIDSLIRTPNPGRAVPAGIY